MRSKLYTFITILLFAILYCYTAIGVLIVLIFAWLKMKGPIRILTKL